MVVSKKKAKEEFSESKEIKKIINRFENEINDLEMNNDKKERVLKELEDYLIERNKIRKG